MISAVPIAGPTAADCEPVANPRLDTLLTTTVTGLPILGLGLAGWQMWGGALHWQDLLVLLVMYALWGGAVRIVLLHHATYSINSLCHRFGRRPFATGDESRNLAWLAPLSFGEAWHNNQHAFPQSAAQGLRRREFDLSALVIRALERVGLVWDVVRIPPARRLKKAR